MLENFQEVIKLEVKYTHCSLEANFEHKGVQS